MLVTRERDPELPLDASQAGGLRGLRRATACPNYRRQAELSGVMPSGSWSVSDNPERGGPVCAGKNMINCRDSSIQSVEDGALDAFGNFCAQQLVMAGVPREDLIGTRLDGAFGDQRIVDGPAGNPVGGGLPNAGKIVVALETHQAEPAVDTFQKLDSLVRCSPMWQREPRESGIDLSQTVRSAARDTRVALCKGGDSGRGGDVRPEKQGPERKNRETASIRAPEYCALPFPADAVERFIDNGNSNRLAGTEHRHALFAH